MSQPLCIKCKSFPQPEAKLAPYYAHLCLDCFEHEQVEAIGKVDTETQGWDDGKEFAEGLKAAVIEELRTLRRLNYSPEYIDAWKLSAQNIFYSLTDEAK